MINDTTRAALMLVVTNVLSAAVLFGVGLSVDQMAGLTSLVNSTLILGMLVFKKGQNVALRKAKTPQSD